MNSDHKPVNGVYEIVQQKPFIFPLLNPLKPRPPVGYFKFLKLKLNLMKKKTAKKRL